MKRVIIFICILLISASGFSQEPISWHFNKRKLDDKTFEIRFTATIEYPWHIYSTTNSDDLGLPTSFSFRNNPLIIVDSSMKEVGQLIQRKDKTSGIILKYYAEQVEFVQVVKLKANVKTNLSGTIEYMACTDTHCLPPASRNFNFLLQ